jgi:hypothetical protein
VQNFDIGVEGDYSFSLSHTHTYTKCAAGARGGFEGGWGGLFWVCEASFTHLLLQLCACVCVHTFWFSMLRNYNYDHLPSVFIVAPPPVYVCVLCVFECKSEITEGTMKRKCIDSGTVYKFELYHYDHFKSVHLLRRIVLRSRLRDVEFEWNFVFFKRIS